MNLTYDVRLLPIVLGVFLLVVGLAGVDLVTDLAEGATIVHVLSEGGILVAGALGAALVAGRLRAMAREARELATKLAATSADAARWRTEARELMAGLAVAIDAQFEEWGLSPAEKEVALLLLKGLSHREVAEARSVTEATARQQARAVYRKAGLGGRADLAAFFLEDLMLPREELEEPSWRE